MNSANIPRPEGKTLLRKKGRSVAGENRKSLSCPRVHKYHINNANQTHIRIANQYHVDRADQNHIKRANKCHVRRACQYRVNRARQTRIRKETQYHMIKAVSITSRGQISAI